MSLTSTSVAGPREPMRTIPPFACFPTAVHQRIAFFLGWEDIHKFRLACRATCHAVEEELKREMERIVGLFVPQPAVLLERLDAHRGVVGGSCALKFFLREHDIEPHNLDVYVPKGGYVALLQHLTYLQERPPTEDFTFAVDPTPLGRTLASRGLDTIARCEGVGGFRVNLYRARNAADPLPPIARSWCSLLINFFSYRYYGAAYPALLFRGRGVVGRRASREDELVSYWGSRGLDLRLEPHQWSDLGLSPPTHAKYSCPGALRSFEDPGALYARVRLLQDELPSTPLRWRLDDRMCGGSCLRTAARWFTGQFDLYCMSPPRS